VIKQLFVVTLAAYQSRDIPFGHWPIMKCKLDAAESATRRRAILIAHPYRWSCRVSRI